jgi:hypothetical protein
MLSLLVFLSSLLVFLLTNPRSGVHAARVTLRTFDSEKDSRDLPHSQMYPQRRQKNFYGHAARGNHPP